MPRSFTGVKADLAPDSAQARTRLARREVVTAAASLFVDSGYAATTVAKIGELATVPQATVYRLFGSKAGILKAWLDTAIAGDDAPIAVADRPPFATMATSGDPRRLIATFTRVAVAINGRSTDVYRVLVGAAQADPVAADLLKEVRRQRAVGQRRLTRTLGAVSALRPGLSERHAADIVYAVMSPESYDLLVLDRRWAVSRYEKWLQHTLCQQLLT